MSEKTTEQKKPDRRVVRTKKAIRNAFARLISRRSLGEITVKELSEEADINRKTFYNYYSDIFQVMDEVENEVVTAFAEALRSVDLSEALLNPNLIVSRLMDIINNEAYFIFRLNFRKAAAKSPGNSNIAKVIHHLTENGYIHLIDFAVKAA